MYETLQDFIAYLEKAGELKRIQQPVSPKLEITEVADRVMKAEGPALLFEKPAGYDVPLFINAFGTLNRMAAALGAESLDTIAEELSALFKPEVPATFMDKLKMLPKLAVLGSFIPKTVKDGHCKEVILKGEDASLEKFPVLTCWPQDGGPFITLPCVFTRNPETGMRNVGMYRMKVFDARTTGMHWHIHKVGARHYEEYERRGERMPVAVSLGGDPAVTYAATAPLPDEFDEMLFAGFLRKKPVELVKCETNDLLVPAGAEIVIEGYVDPGERRLEGPFGDHTGFYSLADMYPVFHVTCITHRSNPVYPATIVGPPPMEDCWIGKATERIFLPLIRMQLPEIVDMNLPVEGIFHNLAVVSIRKRYPGQARRVMEALWGMGQMMFTKVIIVLDEDADVQDMKQVLWKALNHIDPQRDVMFVKGPVDALDHAAQHPYFGTKMGIDATRKWKEEGFVREWPDVIEMEAEIRKRVDSFWKELGL